MDIIVGLTLSIVYPGYSFVFFFLNSILTLSYLNLVSLRLSFMAVLTFYVLISDFNLMGFLVTTFFILMVGIT